MATKTQAAKAFAAVYGVYDPGTKSYRHTPDSSLSRVDGILGKEWRDRALKAENDLKAAMAYLGVENVYKDKIEEYVTNVGVFSYVPGTGTRVTTALQQFREDLRTVAASLDAEAALDRLSGDNK